MRRRTETVQQTLLKERCRARGEPIRQSSRSRIQGTDDIVRDMDLLRLFGPIISYKTEE